MNRAKKILNLAALTAGSVAYLVATTEASARNARTCGPRDNIVERLAEKYGETRQSIGLGANNDMIEVFASAQTGSWTITVTSATGVTCLVAAGQAFEQVAEALPAEGQDA